MTAILRAQDTDELATDAAVRLRHGSDQEGSKFVRVFKGLKLELERLNFDLSRYEARPLSNTYLLQCLSQEHR